MKSDVINPCITALRLYLGTLALIFLICILFIQPVSSTFVGSCNFVNTSVSGNLCVQETYKLHLGDTVICTWSGNSANYDILYAEVYPYCGYSGQVTRKDCGTGVSGSCTWIASSFTDAYHGINFGPNGYANLVLSWGENLSVRSKPSVSFSASPLSGNSPLTVTFTDGSIGGQNWNWTFDEFQTGKTVLPSVTNKSVNPVAVFVTGGNYSINETVCNQFGCGNLTRNNYINVTTLPPVSAFTCTPLMGTAPLTVSCTDQTTNIPNSETWIFDSSGLGLQVLPNVVNNSIGNKVVQYPYSGVYSLTLNAGNAFGNNSLTKPYYIQVNGTALTPTPTPTPPFPNNTQYCGLYPHIVTGSGLSRPYDVIWTLYRPNDKIQNLYSVLGGVGQTEYTDLWTYGDTYGNYIYQETNTSGNLLWAFSYQIANCTQPSSTPTVIPITIPSTIAPYPTYTSMPIITGTINPVYTIQTISTLPTWNNPIPDSINKTIVQNNLLNMSALNAPYLSTVNELILFINNLVMFLVYSGLNYLMQSIQYITTAISLFTVMSAVYANGATYIFYTFTAFVTALGYKIQAMITFFLVVDTIKQVWYIQIKLHNLGG